MHAPSYSCICFPVKQLTQRARVRVAGPRGLSAGDTPHSCKVATSSKLNPWALFRSAHLGLRHELPTNVLMRISSVRFWFQAQLRTHAATRARIIH